MKNKTIAILAGIILGILSIFVFHAAVLFFPPIFWELVIKTAILTAVILFLLWWVLHKYFNISNKEFFITILCSYILIFLFICRFYNSDSYVFQNAILLAIFQNCIPIILWELTQIINKYRKNKR